MECGCCGGWRSKKLWAKPQLDARSTAVGGWEHCKVCMARPPDHSEIAVWQLHVRQSAQEARKHATYLQKWLVHSIEKESEAERRKKSHCGAVKSRRKADPCH